MPESINERDELHRVIWKIADGLRGSVDGWDFKQYVLGILFYRYISENLSTYVDNNQKEAGVKGFSYAKLPNKIAEQARGQLVEEKGFFILPSELFCNVADKCELDENLNITLGKIFTNIENSAMGTSSENDFKGLFDDVDVNSKKLGGTVTEKNKRLCTLLKSIAEMKLGDFQDNKIDAFGDAYEYLMTMYAANAGKSGGEFFTPQEVSELLAKLALIDYNSKEKNYKRTVNKVYDPACGSGSLLLKFAKLLGADNVKQGYFGQEINLTTYNLARINMFLHDVNFSKFNIAHGDTLIDPKHWEDQPFDAIVSNPPYGLNWESNENPLLINDERFAPAGVLAPKSDADYAFVMHMLYWLSSDGTAAFVESPGILFRSGAEQKIRQYLVSNNYVDTVIMMPKNLFFGTNIQTCIMTLRKNKVDNSILLVDATKYCDKSGKKSKLLPNHIEKIIEIVRKKENSDVSVVVDLKSLEAKNFDLRISAYQEVKVEKKETRTIDEVIRDLKNADEKYVSLLSEVEKLIKK